MERNTINKTNGKQQTNEIENKGNKLNQPRTNKHGIKHSMIETSRIKD